MTVVEDYTGPGRVVGCTVIYERGTTPRAIALIDTDAGARALAMAEDAETIAGMEREEWVGRRVQIIAGRIAL